MPLKIPAALQEKLRQIRSNQLEKWADKVIIEEEAILLDGGLGPAHYLTLDGRIIIWDDGTWLDNTEPHEVHDLPYIFACLAVGAKKFQLPELLQFLPEAPENAQQCEVCQGERLVMNGGVICPKCMGLGWVAPKAD